MHCRDARPAREQPKQAAAVTGAEDQEGSAEDDAIVAAAGRGGADVSLSATTFAPVNMLTWEDQVCWQGAPTGAESEHETDDEQGAAGSAAPAAEGEAALVQPHQQQVIFGDVGVEQGAPLPGFGAPQQPLGGEPQWSQQHAQPPPAAQEQAPMAQPDIAAMFAQQPPVAQQPGLGGMPFENGLPMNGVPLMPGGTDPAAALQPQSGHWVQQQPTLGGWPEQQLGQQFGAFVAAPMPAADLPAELPGLSGASAAELEARAAAESDEEDYFTLPTAPLLRLELLALSAKEGEDDAQELRRLPAAPDMLPGALAPTMHVVDAGSAVTCAQVISRLVEVLQVEVIGVPSVAAL